MDGILYLNSGTKLLARLWVSILSLRKVCDKPITLVCANMPPDPKRILAGYGVSLIEAPIAAGGSNALVAKATLNKYSPYDRTWFLDADTLVLQNFDEVFDLVEKHKLVFTQFACWTTGHRAIKHRLTRLLQLGAIDDRWFKDALATQKMINIGSYGWTKDSSPDFWTEWSAMAQKVQGKVYIPDEVTCQACLGQYPHLIASNAYNISVNRPGYLADGKAQPREGWKIVHYAGHKHLLNPNTAGHAQLWKDFAKQAYKDNAMEFKFIVDTYHYSKEKEVCNEPIG